MGDSYTPLRYLVRLPRGEAELDAVEIMSRFRNREVGTTTRLCVPGEAEWRELREIPEFGGALRDASAELRGREKIGIWGPDFCLLILAGVFLVFPAMGVVTALLCWQEVFLKLGFYVFLSLSLLVAALQTRGAQKKARGALWMIVPYWNCFVGYRDFRRLISHLPSEKRRWLPLLNSLCWGVLLLLLIAGWVVPGTLNGGAVMFSLYGCFWGLLALTVRPLARERRRSAREYLAHNPLPEKVKGNSPLFCAIRKRRRQALRSHALQWAIALALLVAGLTVPYWIVGKIRMWDAKRREGAWSIPLYGDAYRKQAALPHAAPELRKIELPELPEKSDPEDLREIAPKLEAFRAVLRQNESLGVVRDFFNPAEISGLHGKLRCYLRWRLEEVRSNPEVSAAGVLSDLARCREYEVNEDPAGSIGAEICYLELRGEILTVALLRLSPQELESEKAYWKRGEERFSATVRRGLFARRILFAEAAADAMGVPFAYLDNIRATAIGIARRESNALQRDYFRNRAEYAGFVAKLSERGGIYLHELEEPEDLDVQIARGRALCRLIGAGVESEARRRSGIVKPSGLPIDPFSGKRLRRAENRLYSVGPHEGGEISFYLPQIP